MRHHGKGVYTGTFSGTLNPALQDKHGRPKRDISTIIHILNDLLCATPASSNSYYRYDNKSSATSGESNGPSAGTGVPQQRGQQSRASGSSATSTSASVGAPQMFGSTSANGAVTGLNGNEAETPADCSGSLNSECSAGKFFSHF